MAGGNLRFEVAICVNEDGAPRVECEAYPVKYLQVDKGGRFVIGRVSKKEEASITLIVFAD